MYLPPGMLPTCCSKYRTSPNRYKCAAPMLAIHAAHAAGEGVTTRFSGGETTTGAGLLTPVVRFGAAARAVPPQLLGFARPLGHDEGFQAPPVHRHGVVC